MNVADSLPRLGGELVKVKLAQIVSHIEKNTYTASGVKGFLPSLGGVQKSLSLVRPTLPDVVHFEAYGGKPNRPDENHDCK